MTGPLLLVGGAAIVLIASQPDLGTALVIAFTLGALLLVAGMPLALLGKIAARRRRARAALRARRARPRRAADGVPQPVGARRRHRASSPSRARSRSARAGCFGVGLGESVQKVFYLPEAHTDFILAVIGEELGIAGICGLLFLYGLIGYAGLRTAKAAATRYRSCSPPG